MSRFGSDLHRNIKYLGPSFPNAEIDQEKFLLILLYTREHVKETKSDNEKMMMMKKQKNTN